MVVESDDLNESKGNLSNQSLVVLKDKGLCKTGREMKRKGRDRKQQEYERKLKLELGMVTGVRKQTTMMQAESMVLDSISSDQNRVIREDLLKEVASEPAVTGCIVENQSFAVFEHPGSCREVVVTERNQSIVTGRVRANIQVSHVNDEERNSAGICIQMKEKNMVMMSREDIDTMKDSASSKESESIGNQKDIKTKKKKKKGRKNKLRESPEIEGKGNARSSKYKKKKKRKARENHKRSRKGCYPKLR